jgi:hypothetical protein
MANGDQVVPAVPPPPRFIPYGGRWLAGYRTNLGVELSLEGQEAEKARRWWHYDRGGLLLNPTQISKA